MIIVWSIDFSKDTLSVFFIIIIFVNLLLLFQFANHEGEFDGYDERVTTRGWVRLCPDVQNLIGCALGPFVRNGLHASAHGASERPRHAGTESHVHVIHTRTAVFCKVISPTSRSSAIFHLCKLQCVNRCLGHNLSLSTRNGETTL